MARFMAMCTFHLAMGDPYVIATTPVAVSLDIADNGKFTFTFDPNGYEGNPENAATLDHQGWACDDCADKIIPRLTGFREDVEENIIALISAEEAYEEGAEEGKEEEGEESEEPDDGEIIEEEEEPASEDDFHFPGEDEPEEDGKEEEKPEEADSDEETLDPEDAKAVEAHIAPVGEKVIPQGNDMAPEFTENGWRANFPEGYQPSPRPTPKGEERVAVKKWYESLSDKERILVGKMTPVLTSNLTYYWRKSAAYADGFYETLDKSDA